MGRQVCASRVDPGGHQVVYSISIGTEVPRLQHPSRSQLRLVSVCMVSLQPGLIMDTIRSTIRVHIMIRRTFKLPPIILSLLFSVPGGRVQVGPGLLRYRGRIPPSAGTGNHDALPYCAADSEVDHLVPVGMWVYGLGVGLRHEAIITTF